MDTIKRVAEDSAPMAGGSRRIPMSGFKWIFAHSAPLSCGATLFLLASAALAPAASVVTLDSDKVLIINGRKVFTIGFSPGPPNNSTTPSGKDALQELRDAGGLLFR